MDEAKNCAGFNRVGRFPRTPSFPWYTTPMLCMWTRRSTSCPRNRGDDCFRAANDKRPCMICLSLCKSAFRHLKFMCPFNVATIVINWFVEKFNLVCTQATVQFFFTLSCQNQKTTVMTSIRCFLYDIKKNYTIIYIPFKTISYLCYHQLFFSSLMCHNYQFAFTLFLSESEKDSFTLRTYGSFFSP